MLGAIIGLILTCIVIGVIWWACQQLLALIPLAEPFATMVRILLVVLLVVFVIYFITILLGFAGVHGPMWSGLK